MDELSMECKHTASLFMQYAKPHHKILDIGCGSGELSNYLEKRGYHLFYNADIVDIRKHKTRRFTLYDGKVLPFKNSTFDLISLNFVLHHVPDSTKYNLLKEAIRVTNSFIFILEDTPRNSWDRVVNYIHGVFWRYKIKSTAKFGFYTQQEWERIFTESGLKVRVSKKLDRWSRTLKQPCSRSLFLLKKENGTCVKS